MHYQKIEYRVLFLLLLYIFVNSPFILFHHHPNFGSNISYQEFKSTRISTSYDFKYVEPQIVKPAKHCLLCDCHHVVSTELERMHYTLEAVSDHFATGAFLENIIFEFISSSSNKDPPFIA